MARVILPTIEEALGPPNVECPVCSTGEMAGWCCEAHPSEPFPHDDCAGPGMPCACRHNLTRTEEVDDGV